MIDLFLLNIQYIEYFFVFLIGSIFGSFYNMLIFRLKYKISLFKNERSFCPSCKIQLKWYWNIPLFSFLILKGRCGNCNKKIGIRYLIVEILTSFSFLISFIFFNISSFFFLFNLIISLFIIYIFIKKY